MHRFEIALLHPFDHFSILLVSLPRQLFLQGQRFF